MQTFRQCVHQVRKYIQFFPSTYIKLKFLFIYGHLTLCEHYLNVSIHTNAFSCKTHVRNIPVNFWRQSTASFHFKTSFYIDTKKLDFCCSHGCSTSIFAHCHDIFHCNKPTKEKHNVHYQRMTSRKHLRISHFLHS